MNTSLSDFLARKNSPLSALINELADGCISISEAVRNAATLSLTGALDTTNVQGEVVQKLDDLSNTILVEATKKASNCGAYMSEEVVGILQQNDGGKYIVAIDPLDGSSNIDIAAPVGTIFAIWERKSSSGNVTTEDYLQAGNTCIGAGFVLYGSSTLLILTLLDGVHLFSYNTTSTTFELITEKMSMPKTGSIYSLNQGNLATFEERATQFIAFCTDREKPFALRYIGSMVGDMYRTFLKGGIFLYPAAKGTTKGKLRLLYECIPMALLTEQAGGKATNGQISILEITPTELHERCAIIIGSADLVDTY